eukprot:TRINITY_DN30416_c0_g1_i1.p1 TRINITY_DN30416_c0_g1~~TRINITY_DN30416_c0_g1_i1.p1  ORF type:complete len:107 (-),score=31.19 TRINITY_DN30416_c0_g1_i1:66-386(-)
MCIRDRSEESETSLLRELQSVLTPHVWTRKLQMPRHPVMYCLIKCHNHVEAHALRAILGEEMERQGLDHLEIDWALDRQLSLIHISEPTRLLSISYAVFCLKKKKN